VPGGAPPAAGPVMGNVPDPNAALIQGALTATQAMTQMNFESKFAQCKYDPTAGGVTSSFNAGQSIATPAFD